jgi:hypothetical protein
MTRMKPFGAQYRPGQVIRITEGHGDCVGATGTLVRHGPRRQWLVELDQPWAAPRPEGLAWVWAEEMEYATVKEGK